MNQPVILITGALTGIGRATAFAFAESGARLVVSGRREAEGKALEAELRELGADAHFIQADVRRDEEVASLVDQTVARFGRLDAAVNNAGTEGQPGPITSQTAESYAATFDTNVLGTLLSMKHELRVMSAQKSGSIVNVSSTYGHEGAAYASVYAGSKHAVEGMTKSAALEVRGDRRARERRCARTDRHRHARPLHRHGGKQGCARREGAARACRQARRCGASDRVRRIGCGVVRDGANRDGRRWQDCRLIDGRSVVWVARRPATINVQRGARDCPPAHTARSRSSAPDVQSMKQRPASHDPAMRAASLRATRSPCLPRSLRLLLQPKLGVMQREATRALC